MLESVLDCGRGIETLDVLVNQPEELTPEQRYPVIVLEPLRDVVWIGGDQIIFVCLEHFPALSRILLDFLFLEGSPCSWRLPVCVVTGGALQVDTA